MSIVPLKNNCKLAATPTNRLRYGVKVKNKAGEEILLADPRATRALIALMDQHAVVGGAAAHWGGPSAFCEINSAIHGLMFKERSWFESYNYVNDAGHAENGVYALRANYGFDQMSIEDLWGFRSIKSKLTGHGEAHLNPQGVFISNGPLGSGIAQAQGLALADRVLGNERVTVCVISDGASMEGEAKEAYAAIPGLAQQGKLNPLVMVISDNNTKLSGRIDQEAFSMSPSFLAMESLGWKVIRIEQGNDLQKVFLGIEAAFEAARANSRTPVCVIAKTVKGFGVKSTEESSSGGHGYPLKAYDGKIVGFIEEIYGGNPPAELVEVARRISQKPADGKKDDGVKTEKVQVGIAKGMIKAAHQGFPVYSVSSDVPGSTGVQAFQKEFPQFSQDVGIAEANMIGMAVGLSKQGFIPVVDTFAQFGITKGNLPLIMSSLSQGPIIGVFSHAGFQDAADGASHQATTYISAIASIPHLQLIQLSCSEEAASYMYQAIEYFKKETDQGRVPETIIFLLGRENYPVSLDQNETYQWGKAQILAQGDDITVVASGPMVFKALSALELFKKNGIKATVINNRFVNRPDIQTIGKSLAKTKRLITIEDHQVMGGMGALLSHALLQNDYSFKMRSLGIKGRFGQSAYLVDQLYDLYDLNAPGLLRVAQELMG